MNTLSNSNDISQLLSQKFESMDELLNFTRDFFKSRGYLLSIRSSRCDRYVIVGCNRGGRYRDTRQVPPELRKRKRTSRLTGCPFEIRGKRQVGGSWVVEVKDCSHNHEPYKDGAELVQNADGQVNESLENIVPRDEENNGNYDHNGNNSNSDNNNNDHNNDNNNDNSNDHNNDENDHNNNNHNNNEEEEEEEEEEQETIENQPLNKQNHLNDQTETANFLQNSKFYTRDELLNTVRAYYTNRGFALTTSCSRANKYVILCCSKSGFYRNTRNIPTENRKRKTKSRLTGCPFKIRGKMQKDGFWRVEIANSLHNHDPDLSEQNLSRKLTQEEILRIEEMTKLGLPPREILYNLKEKNPDLKLVSRSIYNAKMKIQKDNLAGRTMVQALFEEMKKSGFSCNFLRDQSGNLTHLFVAHPLSVVLSKSFSNIFVMNLHRNNGYKFPLLNILGLSSFNSCFYSCFAFLEKEEVENYVWALKIFANILSLKTQPCVILSDKESGLMEAIEVVFPETTNLFCLSRVEKDVKENCKGCFEKKEDWDAFFSNWKIVMSSKSEGAFMQTWSDFELVYSEKKEVINYLKSEWLPYKEKFIDAWTEKYYHFGTKESLKFEEAHEKLKKYLQANTRDMKEVKNKLCSAIENEFKQNKTQLESEKIRVLHSCCNIPLFREIICKISEFSLVELHKQYEKVKAGTFDPICSGRFTATMGLPCAHIMLHLDLINLNLVHQQWRIDLRKLVRPTKMKGLIAIVDLNANPDSPNKNTQ
ncbi:hypothetical protein LUZ60_007000 [Juncus effusus]|nr:hypothetical protein LUZ60_007000 [Juncus effusus]